MKELITITAMGVLMIASGCMSTVTHYDGNGNITKVEKVTNSSRFYDGTNSKSQIVLVDAIYLKSEVSATAGDAYMPGWDLTFVNGKSAVLNVKDNAKFDKASEIVDSFFKDMEVSKDGIKATN